MKYNDNGTIKEISVKASDTLPIGSIVAYSSSKAPENWLICDGSEISRTSYSDLFNIIGTTYGEGDGSTTFNLPNLKGKVITGLDSNDSDFDTLGNTGGEKEHKHDLSSGYARMYIEGKTLRTQQSSSNNTVNNYAGTLSSGGSDAYQTQGSTALGGNSGNASSLQPYIVQNYIIKARQSIAVIGKVLNSKSKSTQDTYSCNYINKLHTYSDEEQVIGTYMNKPLYSKVVTGTLTTPNINSNTWNNLTNNASELVNVYGTVAGRPYNNTIVLKDNSYVLALDIAIANNTIMYRNLGLPENSVFTLTIEYTKTTD